MPENPTIHWAEQEGNRAQGRTLKVLEVNSVMGHLVTPASVGLGERVKAHA